MLSNPALECRPRAARRAVLLAFFCLCPAISSAQSGGVRAAAPCRPNVRGDSERGAPCGPQPGNPPRCEGFYVGDAAAGELEILSLTSTRPELPIASSTVVYVSAVGEQGASVQVFANPVPLRLYYMMDAILGPGIPPVEWHIGKLLGSRVHVQLSDFGLLGRSRVGGEEL